MILCMFVISSYLSISLTSLLCEGSLSQICSQSKPFDFLYISHFESPEIIPITYSIFSSSFVIKYFGMLIPVLCRYDFSATCLSSPSAILGAHLIWTFRCLGSFFKVLSIVKQTILVSILDPDKNLPTGSKCFSWLIQDVLYIFFL